MQLFMKSSEENTKINGLNLINGKVVNFNNYIHDQPIPHIGWEKTFSTRLINNKLLNVVKNKKLYFAHSYLCVFNKKYDFLYSSYNKFKFVSAFSDNNIIGIQFHPELSGEVGSKFLSKFVAF